MSDVEFLPAPRDEEGRVVEIEAELDYLGARVTYSRAPAGMTIQEMLGDSYFRGVVLLNGQPVPQDRWALTRPEPGSVLRLFVPAGGGGGGKSILRIVALVAVVALAVFVPYLAPAGWGLVAGGSLTLTGLAVSAAISFGGNLLINGLLPPSVPSLPNISGGSFKELNSITNVSNQVDKFGAVNRLFGRKRFFPKLAGLPYTEYVGDTENVYMLLILGIAPMSVSELKVGDTTFEDFNADEELIRYEISERPSLYANDPSTQSLSLTMDKKLDTFTRTTGLNTDEIAVDLIAPQGLFAVDRRGNTDGGAVYWTIEYRRVGTTTWLDATQAAGKQYSAKFITDGRQPPRSYKTLPGYIQNSKTTYKSPVYDSTNLGQIRIYGGVKETRKASIRWRVGTGQYDVRVTRLDTVWDYDDRQATFSGFTWVALKSITHRSPVNMPGVLFMAVQIKASDSLQGVIDQINVVGQSHYRTFDGTKWTAPVPTSNCAWAYVESLTGPGCAEPVGYDAIDGPTMKSWAADCKKNGWEYNVNVDTFTSGFDLARDIAMSGFASWAMNRQGLYSVVRDLVQTIPRQIFTPDNSWGFSSSKTIAERVHALRMQFDNKEKGWDPDEVFVYNDGFSAATATIFETMQLAGIDNAKQAQMLGRYEFGATDLRPETYTLSTDVRHLKSGRGDLVYVQHPVPLWGKGSGWVIGQRFSRTDGRTVQFVIDDAIVLDGSEDLIARVQHVADGSIDLVSLRGTYIDLENTAIWMRDAGEYAYSNAAALNVTGMSHTIEIWCYLPASVSLGSGRYLFYQGSTGNNLGIQIGITNTNKLRYNFQNDQIEVPPIARDRWTHIACTYDAASLVQSVYVDGVLAGTRTATGSQRGPNVTQIGRTNNSDTYRWTGYIDSVRIWNTTLSAEYIAANLDTQYAGNEANLIALYRFVETDGTKLSKNLVANGDLILVSDPRYVDGRPVNIGPSIGRTNTFQPVKPMLALEEGDLVTLGTTVNETTELKISRIETLNGDQDARMTLVDAAPELANVFTRPIPDYDSNITKPTALRDIVPPAPVITTVRSDETVMYATSGGSLKLGISVAYRIPGQIRLPGLRIEGRYTKASTPGAWKYAPDSEGAAGSILMSDVEQGKTYLVEIRCTNQGKSSPWTRATETVIGRSSLPPTPTNFFGKVESYGIQLGWDPSPVLDVTAYQLSVGPTLDSLTDLGNLSANSTRLAIRAAGTHLFWLWAIDDSGNISQTPQTTSVVIAGPTLPALTTGFSEGNFTLNWTVGEGDYPIDYSVVKRGSSFENGTTIFSGRSTRLVSAVSWANTERLWVVNYDIAGNASQAASSDIAIKLPVCNKVTVEVIDNNVLLRWSSTPGSLPIKDHQIYRGSITAANLVGTSATTFSSLFETKAGSYSYILVPRDTANNPGQSFVISATVNEPPDFVLYDQFEESNAEPEKGQGRTAAWSGTKTSALALDNGQLIAPFPVTETPNNKSSTYGFATPQAAINAGYLYPGTPAPTAAAYEFVYDLGTPIPSTRLSTTRRSTLYGDSTLTETTTLSVQAPGSTTYSAFPAGQESVFATNFKAVKNRLALTTGNNKTFAIYDALHTTLAVKLKEDAGSQLLKQSGKAVYVTASAYMSMAQPNIGMTDDDLHFTLECWTAVDSFSTVYLWGPSGASNWWLRFESGNRVRVGWASPGNASARSALSAAGLISAGEWVHVCLTVDGRNLALYLNGVLGYSITDTAAIGAPTGNWFFGRRATSSSGAMPGRLDGIAIWNFARTAADIKARYEAGYLVGDTGLVHYFQFNEGSGTTVKDDVGGGNGTLAGTVQWIENRGDRINFNVAFVDVNAITLTPNSLSPLVPVYDFLDNPYPTYFRALVFDQAGNRVSNVNVSWTARGA